MASMAENSLDHLRPRKMETTRKKLNHFKSIKKADEALTAIQKLPDPDEGKGDEHLNLLGKMMMIKR